MAQFTERSGRQLAAIVFTDIVNFSAFVHRDEVLGERLLLRQSAVVLETLPRFGGRAIKTAGDSYLLEFGSALAALDAVVAIYQALQAACDRHPADPPVLLRAGIHLGDIEYRGSDIFGDGVNTAARLLPLAPPGGIALSAAVLASVRQRRWMSLRSIGMPALKNIESPVEVFVCEHDAVLAADAPPNAVTARTEAAAVLPEPPRSFFAELQRRHVYRAGAMYAVGGWLGVQVATQVLPFFDVPNWVIRGTVLAIVLGMPVVLLLSWFYELTPQGLVRDSERPPEPDGGPRPVAGGRRLWFAVLAIVVALLIADIALREAGPGRDGTPVVAALPSLAVMPFKISSDEAANGYLASGLQDEILTRLSKIDSLKVISRTSTAFYAAQPANLRQIAKELGVTHVVEGSVQRRGDAARIAVQLIAADSDTNVWAETYDRNLTDIFTVESEVAKAIATALQAKLSGRQQQDLTVLPTENPKAYDAYLRSVAYEVRSFERSNLASTTQWLEKAVALDPDFALAWARLARIDARRAFYGFDLAQRPCDRAHQALEQAQHLGPELGESALAEGYVRLMCDDDLKRSEAAFQRATERLPNSADVLRGIALIQWRRGDLPGVLVPLAKAVQLDPRNTELLSSFALYLGMNRNFPLALETADRVLDIDPDDPSITALSMLINQASGRLDEAQASLGNLAEHMAAPDLYDPRMLQLLYRGRFDEAIEALQRALAGDVSKLGVDVADYHLLLATAQLAAGHAADAHARFARLESIMKQHDNGAMSDLTSSGSYIRSMRCIAAAGQDAARITGEECTRLQTLARADSQLALSALEALTIAKVLAGQLDMAVNNLAELLKRPYASTRYTVPLTPALLRQDPIWRPLQANARFRKLAELPAGDAAAAPAAAVLVSHARPVTKPSSLDAGKHG